MYDIIYRYIGNVFKSLWQHQPDAYVCIFSNSEALSAQAQDLFTCRAQLRKVMRCRAGVRQCRELQPEKAPMPKVSARLGSVTLRLGAEAGDRPSTQ